MLIDFMKVLNGQNFFKKENKIITITMMIELT